MRFSLGSAFSALFVFPALTVAHPTAILHEKRDTAAIDYDAIIVGGGPAGLAALSGLARVNRNVLLIDSGVYRNGPTRHMHDVLGFDGVTPAYFRWAAREQISHYTTVKATNGTVTKIDPTENNSYFTVSTTDGPDGQSQNATARKVVLATGIHDDLPDTPGIRENWGKGIFWCPWCDGHEHANQSLGLIGALTDAPGSVREMLTLNTDIVALVNGTDTPDARAATEAKFPGWETFLRIHNVTIENRTIASLTRLRDGGDENNDPSLPSAPEYDLFRVDFVGGGEPLERSAFLTSFPDEQASRVGEEAGVTLYGGRLAADQAKGLVTNVPGLYAIGDANSDNVTNVPHALFSGKRTAVYLHVQIGREDAAAEIAGADGESAPQRRDIHLEARELWNTVNGDDASDILYAGEFDQ